MQFGVIYSIDVPGRKTKFGEMSPMNIPGQKGIWCKTEGDEQYDYDYLENEWKAGRHGKYCACLTKKQFIDFVKQTNLFADSIETMGSLGCPNPNGICLSLSPAICFNGDFRDKIAKAYVTPYPEIKKKTVFTERDWKRIRKTMIRIFG